MFSELVTLAVMELPDVKGDDRPTPSLDEVREIAKANGYPTDVASLKAMQKSMSKASEKSKSINAKMTLLDRFCYFAAMQQMLDDKFMSFSVSAKHLPKEYLSDTAKIHFLVNFWIQNEYPYPWFLHGGADILAKRMDGATYANTYLVNPQNAPKPRIEDVAKEFKAYLQYIGHDMDTNKVRHEIFAPDGKMISDGEANGWQQSWIDEFPKLIFEDYERWQIRNTLGA